MKLIKEIAAAAQQKPCDAVAILSYEDFGRNGMSLSGSGKEYHTIIAHPARIGIVAIANIEKTGRKTEFFSSLIGSAL